MPFTTKKAAWAASTAPTTIMTNGTKPIKTNISFPASCLTTSQMPIAKVTPETIAAGAKSALAKIELIKAPRIPVEPMTMNDQPKTREMLLIVSAEPLPLISASIRVLPIWAPATITRIPTTRTRTASIHLDKDFLINSINRLLCDFILSPVFQKQRIVPLMIFRTTGWIASMN